MSTGGLGAAIEVASAILLLSAGPLLAAVRILSLLSFGGLMAGVAVPWRYRVAGSLLLGWAVSGPLDRPLPALPMAVMSEFACGGALGVGVGGLLLGLKLAGELIDDRLGLTEAASEVACGDGEEAGPCVRLLGGLGLMLVILGGTDGGFPVLEGLLGNFRTIPVGDLPLSGEDWRIALRLLTGSLEITLRTALPVLAAMTIIDWCQLLVTRAAPTSPAGVLSGAVKPLLGLAVLVATFGGGCEAVVDGVRWRLAGV